MRLKWFWVGLLCATLLHSACLVRAQHEDYPEEEETAVDDNGQDQVAGEDLIPTADDEQTTHDDPPPPAEEDLKEDPPTEEHVEEVEAEEVEPSAGNEDHESVDMALKPVLGSKRSGNYYFDDDYYSSNYDVDINYDWSKYREMEEEGSELLRENRCFPQKVMKTIRHSFR